MHVQQNDLVMSSLPALPLDTQYFAPSRDTWVLAILDALRYDSALSQRDLAKRLGLSGAVVNQHLRELQERGLIRFEARNGKSYRYIPTAAGEDLHAEMACGFSSEAIRIYTALKRQVAARLKELSRRNIERLAFFGASETCEVALSALGTMPVKVVAVVDNDPDKQGTLFHGYVVSPPHVLEMVDCQAVLITSFGRRDEIRQQLEPLCRARGMEMVSL